MEQVKIGYLGPEGTFSHEAAAAYSSERGGGALVPAPSIPDLALRVAVGELAEAVLPIENSLEGGVIPTMDMLLEDLDVAIKAELTLQIRENLMVRAGTARQDIRTIVSHPQPLGQCRNYIHMHFPNARLRSVDSTTIAAEAAAGSDGSVAAIGSAAAAALYGLHILERDIQDLEKNYTRFVVLGKADAPHGPGCKTSIAFSVGHTPGRLYQILGIFDIWDLNMTRIESRPSRKAPGEYIFFVDLDGHREDPDVRDALKMLRRKTLYYKFLGSYPTSVRM